METSVAKKQKCRDFCWRDLSASKPWKENCSWRREDREADAAADQVGFAGFQVVLKISQYSKRNEKILKF